MVDAREDVFDAEFEIDTSNRESGLMCRDLCLWMSRCQPLRPRRPVGKLQTHQHIGHRGIEPDDAQTLTAQRVNGLHAPSLNGCVMSLMRYYRGEILSSTGEFR